MVTFATLIEVGQYTIFPLSDNVFTMKRYILLFVCAATLFCGCHHKGTKNEDGIKSESPVVLPDFDVDSAYSFVKAQTDFGPRVPGTAIHDQCCNYLTRKLADYCDSVVVQRFTATIYDGQKIPASNIIGIIAPEKSMRVLLAAHWDSRPFADHDPDPDNRNKPIDGANDGASGVGVLLEMARQWQLQRPDIGIDIIFFDVEDYGPPNGSDVHGDWWGLGSQYWAKNPHTADYTAKYGILLDMVGSPNARFLQEGYSVRFAQETVSKIWATAYRLGYHRYFVNAPGDMITDDHYYVNRHSNVRMVDIIHLDRSYGTGFDRVWHTLEDNIHNIDKNMLGVVGTTLLQVIRDEK